MFSTYSTSEVSGVVCMEALIIDASRRKLMKGQSKANKKKYAHTRQNACGLHLSFDKQYFNIDLSASHKITGHTYKS